MRTYLNAAWAFIIIITAASYAAVAGVAITAYDTTMSAVASTTNALGQWLVRISA